MDSVSGIPVLVVVPTYQRPQLLVWSLLSVLRQQVPASKGVPRRVVVVNNGTDSQSVDLAVAEALRQAGANYWAVSIIHRDPPLDPQLSWYGAIEACASDGEIAFLHGDDDLLLPGSIALRAAAIVSARASMLLSHSYGGLFFESSDSRKAYLKGAPRLRQESLSWTIETPSAAARYSSAFIGNHCYRVDAIYRDAVQRSLSWMRTVPISGTQQLAMHPYFLPIAIADSGRLAGTSAACVVRGQSTRDLVGNRFGHGTWSPGVLYAAALHVLVKGPLASRDDLDPLRVQLRKLVGPWRLPTLAIGSTRRQWHELDGDAYLEPTTWRNGIDEVRGALMVLRAATGTQALRTRLIEWRDGITREQLFRRLGY